MDNIILYTLKCPKCNVIEIKLRQKNLKYTIIEDVDTVVKVGKDHNIAEVPILQVNDSFLDFPNAVKYINEVK